MNTDFSIRDKFKLYMASVCLDYVDTLLNELKPHLRHDAKHYCSKAMIHTRQFIKQNDEILNDSNVQESFGNASDFLKAMVDDHFEPLIKQIEEEQENNG